MSISIEGDLSNAAGSNAGIGATMGVQGVPVEYTYAPPTP